MGMHERTLVLLVKNTFHFREKKPLFKGPESLAFLQNIKTAHTTKIEGRKEESPRAGGRGTIQKKNYM